MEFRKLGSKVLQFPALVIQGIEKVASEPVASDQSHNRKGEGHHGASQENGRQEQDDQTFHVSSGGFGVPRAPSS